MNKLNFLSRLSSTTIYIAGAVIFLAVLGFAVFGGYFRSFGRESSFVNCPDCNLIMISLSNVGAEHMSLYGYERATTPRLDRWAEDAVVFKDTFVQSSWTLPVGTSLFTGLYPYSHGVLERQRAAASLQAGIETLPEILGTAVGTAAFTGGLITDKIHEGFRSLTKPWQTAGRSHRRTKRIGRDRKSVCVTAEMSGEVLPIRARLQRPLNLCAVKMSVAYSRKSSLKRSRLTARTAIGDTRQRRTVRRSLISADSIKRCEMLRNSSIFRGKRSPFR